MELENKSTTESKLNEKLHGMFTKDILENEVVTVDITEGDYNDVYRRGPIVKGTWKQIEEFVKSYFSKEGLERAEEIGSDGYGLAVWQGVPDEVTDPKTGERINQDDPRFEEIVDGYESEIEYYVSADPVDEDDTDKEVVDLTKEETN